MLITLTYHHSLTFADNFLIVANLFNIFGDKEICAYVCEIKLVARLENYSCN